jgi:hypothetical protein
MLVILANRWDDSAFTLASQWRPSAARVLTARDLSRPGWSQRLGRPAESTLVIGDELIPQHQLTGVLTRLPCVFEEELEHILAPDRTFVAAEMNASLTFWLSCLTCPVINSPSPGCLNGPAWRTAKWTCVAAQAGIPISPIPTSDPITAVTVVGGACPLDADPQLQAHALKLAARASVDLLTVLFAGACFHEVNLLPDLSDPVILAALQTLFVAKASR